MPLKVGLIGYGGMGSTHASLIDKHEGVKLTAVADVEPARRQLAEETLGVKTYADGESLIAAGGFDVIFVCAPTYLHAPLAVKALESGCDVFSEKPMALNVGLCQSMIDAQKRAGKSLLIGQVLRFWPEYVFLKEAIADGRYGKLNSLSMTRVGNKSIGWQNWFLDEDRGGMQIFDRHIHDTDAVLWMLGKPKAVRAWGLERDPHTDGGIYHSFTQYIYDDMIVNAEGSADTPKGFPFTAKYRAGFENGVLDFVNTRKPTLLEYTGGPGREIEFGASQEMKSNMNITNALPYYLEQCYFFDCLKRGEKPQTVTPETAMETIGVVQAEIESVRTNREVVL